MGKTVIAPIVATIAILAQLVFGIEIPADVVDQLVVVAGNAVAIGFVIYGIVKNHKKDLDATRKR